MPFLKAICFGRGLKTPAFYFPAVLRPVLSGVLLRCPLFCWLDGGERRCFDFTPDFETRVIFRGVIFHKPADREP